VRTYLGDGYWLAPRFGTERLMNAVDHICREHDDLWEAARQIANEIHNVDVKTACKFVPSSEWNRKR